MNRKRFAIKFADLKDQTTYNQINKVFGYLVDFPIKEFENPGFTSTKAHLIYNRTLTIVESTLSDEEKREVLKCAVEDLLSNEDDIKNIEGILTINEEGKTIEIIKYISKEDYFNEIDVLLEKYLPISFFDENEKNDKFKNYIIDSYKKNKAGGNHQFAYISYYMLFISYLYKVVWELKTIGDNGIITDIETFTQNQLGNDLNLVFDLSGIGEESFCKKINSFVKCLHKNEIDEIANFVQKRNHCAHPSGIIQYSESEVENLISKIDTYTEKIQKKVNIQLLQYTKDNLDTISFNEDLILSESEVLFLLGEKDNILNFNSDSEKNINKKVNFINLIYNEYTKNINFEESKIFKLFIELLKGYNKDIHLYNIIQKEFPLIIGGFSKKEIEEIIEIIKKIKLGKDDEKSSIEFINNI